MNNSVYMSIIRNEGLVREYFNGRIAELKADMDAYEKEEGND